MKFPADENIGYKTIKPLRKLGFDINTTFAVVILGSVATPESNQERILDKPE